LKKEENKIFSFYGSKSKIVKYYPEPEYDEIFECFAGSSRYGLLYWYHDVTIIDADEIVIGVWKYLQQTTPKRILSLPDVPNATKLETIDGFSQLCQEEKWLIGFCSNGGSAQPKNVSGRHNFNSWNKDKKRIANSLYKIRHWKILLGDYSDLPNKKGTWFVDSPYQNKGKWYRKNHIDYQKLGEWCKARLGQTIVCENMGADWLPFTHLKDVAFTHFKGEQDYHKKTAEAIYVQDN
jgi:hypothetical protein